MSDELASMPALRGSATLAEQLRDVIRESIVDGTLTAGSRLSPDQLADHFGVSRIPVREALSALDADGWVEIRPRYGVYVRERQPRELIELFEVRASLEATACALASERATPSDVADLDEFISRARAQRDDPARFAATNSAFHRRIVEAADNQVLASMMRSIRLRVQWYFTETPPTRTGHSLDEHEAIRDAIAAGDATRAAALADAHVRATLAVLRRELATAP